MAAHDGGLAHDYWKQYYTPEEVDELIARTETTMIVSGNYPIHLRIAAQPAPAPTVVMAHGLLLYGTIFGRIILPFARAGFNVVQFDFPGCGQSGGPRGGCTIGEMIQAWKEAIAFAGRRFGTPLYILGVAEDGVLAYYAAANMPEIAAMTVHVLIERGDPASLNWLGGPRMVRVKQVGYRIASLFRPTFRIRGTRSLPWADIFAGPGDDRTRAILANDPLGLQWVQARFGSSFIARARPPIPFEACRTPIQMIASGNNKHWPFERMRQEYERLGGPKELICLEGRPHFELNRAFQELYCAHAIRWFQQHGAEPVPAADQRPDLNPT